MAALALKAADAIVRKRSGAEDMKRRLTSLVGLAALALALTGARSVFAAPTADERGQYVVTMSDCEACHTAPGGKRLAGGLPLESPLGAIYSTNITPSKSHGIGNYTLEQFTRVLRNGVRADGAHLYPAMPSTSYAKLSDADIAAMYTYLMHQAPVDEAPLKKTSLPFPYNMRFSMLFWDALFLNPHAYRPDPTKSEAWNRGSTLSKAPPTAVSATRRAAS